MERKEKAAATVRLLREIYPDADCTLAFEHPWHLLVAAILAAQCTDARVNQITPALFARYRTLPELAAADPGEMEGLIRSCGLFRNKTKAILGASRQLVQKHQGQVPANLADLESLPGIGRKIANLILGDCFHIPAIVVDTHCARIAALVGLTASSNPVQVERDLALVLDRRDWIAFGHLCVSHGRAVCVARRPACGRCPLRFLCDYALARPEPAAPQSGTASSPRFEHERRG
jgi:endonuclease-3